MQSRDVKQRKKASDAKENGEKRRPEEKDEDKSKRDAEERKHTRSSDVKLVLSLVALAVSVVVMILYQHSSRFTEIKEQYDDLYEKTRRVLELQSQMSSVSDKCERVQSLMSSLKRPPAVSHLESLDVEVSRLKEKFSNLTRQRQRLQENLSGLVQAVQNVENRTLAISSDVMSKVASVRTDVRRMSGLEGEVEDLLSQTNTLEEKVAQTEKLMIKRIADLLAGSIDRVSAVKSTTERNAQRLDHMAKLIQDLSTANSELSERILTLESAQAKMLKMSTFAADLKPKVFTIRQDFIVLESKLSELTLRIGLIAEDVMREEQLTEMKNHQPYMSEDSHDI
ncbi:inhibitor of nuclear factor kappa-B kinase-interacting protein isoform X2 [Triplophysa rosa]|uniref:inhibitor of nuclear factor kappa-B kinase-interacting protein isoform X2 n=1 Tax=Triplophysa rosa TaxID=992332 RepID=UPI002545CA82|nr:inhibitor of nuclear factor kappa-B kinase-interacting protein isoform X2 [Triplophysa rosa]